LNKKFKTLLKRDQKRKMPAFDDCAQHVARQKNAFQVSLAVMLALVVIFLVFLIIWCA